jgi:hypothetical protein
MFGRFNDPLGLNSLANTVDLLTNTVDSLANTVNKVVALSKDFSGKPEIATDTSDLSAQVIEKLFNTPGMIQSRGTKFKKATPNFKLNDGTILKTYRNSVGINYIFLADASGRMIFGGYVDWMHSENLKVTVAEIKKTFV